MSITVSNWKQICDAPTNRSRAKMTYSFSKAPRFRTPTPDKSTLFYQIPTTNNRRSTSLGRGNKYDFTKDQPQSPPSNAYNIPSSFKLKEGFCFGQGRQQMIVTGPLADTLSNKNPGPGAYQPLKKWGIVAYSIKGKVKPPQSQTEKVPGPGAYKQNNFFQQKEIYLSKHVNHKAVTFRSGGERFKQVQNATPGPAHYNTKTVELSSQGQYSLSNFHNSKVRSFGHTHRKPLNQSCQSSNALIKRQGRVVTGPLVNSATT